MSSSGGRVTSARSGAGRLQTGHRARTTTLRGTRPSGSSAHHRAGSGRASAPIATPRQPRHLVKGLRSLRTPSRTHPMVSRTALTATSATRPWSVEAPAAPVEDWACVAATASVRPCRGATYFHGTRRRLRRRNPGLAGSFLRLPPRPSVQPSPADGCGARQLAAWTQAPTRAASTSGF